MRGWRNCLRIWLRELGGKRMTPDASCWTVWTGSRCTAKMDQVMINGRLVSDSGREMKTLKERLNRIGRQEHKFRQYLQNAEDMGKSLSVEETLLRTTRLRKRAASGESVILVMASRGDSVRRA